MICRCTHGGRAALTRARAQNAPASCLLLLRSGRRRGSSAAEAGRQVRSGAPPGGARPPRPPPFDQGLKGSSLTSSTCSTWTALTINSGSSASAPHASFRKAACSAA